LPNATLFKPREPYKRCIRETFKDFSPSSLPLIESLLAIDPAERQTATAALKSEVSCDIFNFFFLFWILKLLLNLFACVMVSLIFFLSTSAKSVSSMRDLESDRCLLFPQFWMKEIKLDTGLWTPK
jgi:hypothetical protein